MSLRLAWRVSGKFRLGAIITLALVLAGAFHSVLTRLIIGGRDPHAVGSFGIFEHTSWAHWFGTDRYGWDVLGLVLAGLPISLTVAAIAGGISTIVGTIVDFIAGYKGGATDSALRTFTDIFLVIPSLPIILILSTYVRDLSVSKLALVLAIFSWPFAARVIRTQVLSLRERPYIELSKMTNMTDREIILQDIMPNMLPYLGIAFAQAAVGSAFALVGLTILGLGPSGLLDLGTLISLGIGWGVLSLGQWPILAAPMGLLILLFLGAALINLGLEEIYNPRLRGEAR